MKVFYISANNFLNDLIENILIERINEQLFFYKFKTIDEAINSNEKPDILFIDIDQKNGVKDTIELIKSIYIYTDIILITFYKEYMLNVLENENIYCILEKPFDIQLLSEIIYKIMIERQLIYDFIMEKRFIKNILFVIGRSLIWQINEKKHIIKAKKQLIIYENIENYSIFEFKSLFYSNIDIFNDKNIKKILHTSYKLNQIEDKFFSIHNIFKYLIDNSFIISHNMSQNYYTCKK